MNLLADRPSARYGASILRRKTSRITLNIAFAELPPAGCLQAAPDLAVLRRRVVLLAGEVALDGWAATHGVGGVAVLGLLVVTSWRVIFVDLDGGFSAFPTFKIHAAECDACQLSLSVWYDRMQVRFDNPAAARAVLNLLRQDRGWSASELRAAPGGATFPSPQGLVSLRRPRFAPAGLARAS